MFSIIKAWVAFGHTAYLTKTGRVYYTMHPNRTHTHTKAKLHSETSITVQCTDIFILKYWLSKKVDTLVYLWRRWSSPSHVPTLYRFHLFPNVYRWLEHFIMLIHLHNISQVAYHQSSIPISLVHSSDITCRSKAQPDLSIWYQSICFFACTNYIKRSPRKSSCTEAALFLTD